MKNYELVSNQKQSDNLISDNYVYNSYKQVDGKKMWRCTNRKCPSKGYISSDDYFTVTENHNHTDLKAKLERKQLLKKIIADGIDNNATNISVITKNTCNITDADAIYGFKYLNDQLTRGRSEKYKAACSGIDNIPECLKKDLNNNIFLQYDNKESRDRILIFYSEFAKIYVENSDVFLIDGTFWSVPLNFYQLLTIKVGVFGNFYALIYILLSNKSENTYTKALKALNSLIDIKVKYVVTDFEQALFNSIQKTFKCKINGCLFHLGQSVYRQMQKIGIAAAYSKDTNLKKCIKKLLNLAFLPTSDVKEVFHQISEDLSNLNYNLKDFLDYFQKTYIGLGIDAPVFKIEFWNCYERVLEGIPRTTNALEGWHRSLNSRCNIAHVNLGYFIDVLRQENERNRINLLNTRTKILLPDKDFRREYTLIGILKSYKIYTKIEYFENLNCVTSWLLEPNTASE